MLVDVGSERLLVLLREGFKVSLPTMCVGERARLIIRSDFGFGDEGDGFVSETFETEFENEEEKSSGSIPF